MRTYKRPFYVLLHLFKRYWFLIIWILLTGFLFTKSFLFYRYEDKFHYLRQILGIGLSISRGSAVVLNMSCLFVLIPMCRALSRLMCQPVPRVISRPFTDAPKSLHLIIVYTILIASVIHICSHIANAINYSKYFNNEYPDINGASYLGQNPVYLLLSTFAGITGIIMSVLLMILFLTSMTVVRRRCYEIFQYSHYLAFPFLLLCLAHPFGGLLKQQDNIIDHPPGCYFISNISSDRNEFQAIEEIQTRDVFQIDFFNIRTKRNPKNIINFTLEEFQLRKQRDQHQEERKYFTEICTEPPKFSSIKSCTWIWVTAAMFLWLIERFVRWWISKGNSRILSAVLYPGNILKLKIHKPNLVNYYPGQFVYINCPEIAQHQWHPFTIAKMLEDGVFCLYIRTVGNWGKSLLHILNQNGQFYPYSLNRYLDRTYLSFYNAKSITNQDNSMYGNNDYLKIIEIPQPSRRNSESRDSIKIEIEEPSDKGSDLPHMTIKSYKNNCHQYSYNIYNSNVKTSAISQKSSLFDNTDPNIILINRFPDVRLHITGPYNSPHQSLSSYPVVIAIVGGIGITPLVGAISEIKKQNLPQPKRIHLVWIVRDAYLILPFASILSSFMHYCWYNQMEDRFEMRFHITLDMPEKLKDTLNNQFPDILSRITHGRPKWKVFFKQWREMYTKANVGVFVCGPKNLSKQIKKHCFRSLAHGCKFTFNHESFS